MDENYLVPALVTLTSLADVLPPPERAAVAIRVLTADLAPGRASTMAAVTRRLGFESFDVHWEGASSCHRIINGSYISSTTYPRFNFTPDFVQTPYLAYVDADVLILGDVAAPFNVLTTGQVGLVRDTLNHTIGRGRALPGVVQRWPELRGLPYYNAGIFWCAPRVLPGVRSCVDRIMARGGRHIYFNDQDALNLWALRCGADIRSVNQIYNTFELDRFREAGDWIGRVANVLRPPASPAVLHFVGPIKPWHSNCPTTEWVRLYRRHLRDASCLIRRAGDLTMDLAPPGT